MDTLPHMLCLQRGQAGSVSDSRLRVRGREPWGPRPRGSSIGLGLESGSSHYSKSDHHPTTQTKSKALSKSTCWKRMPQPFLAAALQLPCISKPPIHPHLHSFFSCSTSTNSVKEQWGMIRTLSKFIYLAQALAQTSHCVRHTNQANARLALKARAIVECGLGGGREGGQKGESDEGRCLRLRGRVGGSPGPPLPGWQGRSFTPPSRPGGEA